MAEKDRPNSGKVTPAKRAATKSDAPASSRRSKANPDADGKPAGQRADKGMTAAVRGNSTRKGMSYQRGIESRERLIQATQGAIVELGFNRASSREVARRAGLTFGVIQHHFGSYEALLLATVAEEGERLRELLATAEITGTTTEERLTCLADIVRGFVSRPENLAFMEIHNNLMRDPGTSADALTLLSEGTVGVEDQWSALMRDAFDWHEPDPGLRRLLFATLRGLAITSWMNQGSVAFERERAIFVEAMAPYFERAARH